MKTKQIALLFAVTTMVLFTAGCEGLTLPGAFGDPPEKWTDSYETESSEEAVIPEKEKPSETTEVTETSETAEDTWGYELSGAELADLTEVFNTQEYYGFLLKPFSSPEDIDWDKVLESGAGISKEASEAEVAKYREVTRDMDYSSMATVITISEKDLAEYLQDHAKVKLDRRTLKLNWRYFEDTKAFYHVHWSYQEEDAHYTCVSGKHHGDTYTLEFRKDDSSEAGDDANRILTVVENGGHYVMQSNEFLWGNNCDPDHSFVKVEPVPGDGVLDLMIYPPTGDSNSCEMYLVKDGKSIDYSRLYCSTGDNGEYLTEISEIAFFDFNADGFKDICITGFSGTGTELVYLDESIDKNYTYESRFDLEDWFYANMGSGYTVRTIKEALLGDNADEVYADYKEAYAQLIKLAQMNENSNYSYDLIDCDGDDIPELMIDGTGYQVSLYSFENGHVHTLMHQWGYGAGGNSGYSYAPGKNVFYNHNQDYAGAIHYESYMTPEEGTEITTAYYKKAYFFNDADGDGYPSEDELENSDFDEYRVDYYCCFDRNTSEDKIRDAIAEYESYDFVEMIGRMSCEEVMKKLGK